jgi:signal peptidase I
MKKGVVIFICLGGFFLLAWFIGRLTHTIDIYKASTTSNLPAFHPGNLIVATRFKSPDNNTFVCFKEPVEKSVWVFRCIGKGGDVVEIKNADVYINGRLLYEPYTWNEYYISKEQLNTIRGYAEKYNYPLRSINDSLYVITFSKGELKTYHLNLKVVTASKGQQNPAIFKNFKKLNYNEDHLGPVKVPEGCYFLLGDNRHDASDSRYFGFIKQSDIVSTVLFH